MSVGPTEDQLRLRFRLYTGLWSSAETMPEPGKRSVLTTRPGDEIYNVAVALRIEIDRPRAHSLLSKLPWLTLKRPGGPSPASGEQIKRGSELRIMVCEVDPATCDELGKPKKSGSPSNRPPAPEVAGTTIDAIRAAKHLYNHRKTKKLATGRYAPDAATVLRDKFGENRDVEGTIKAIIKARIAVRRTHPLEGESSRDRLHFLIDPNTLVEKVEKPGPTARREHGLLAGYLTEAEQTLWDYVRNQTAAQDAGGWDLTKAPIFTLEALRTATALPELTLLVAIGRLCDAEIFKATTTPGSYKLAWNPKDVVTKSYERRFLEVLQQQFVDFAAARAIALELADARGNINPATFKARVAAAWGVTEHSVMTRFADYKGTSDGAGQRVIMRHLTATNESVLLLAAPSLTGADQFAVKTADNKVTLVDASHERYEQRLNEIQRRYLTAAGYPELVPVYVAPPPAPKTPVTPTEPPKAKPAVVTPEPAAAKPAAPKPEVVRPKPTVAKPALPVPAIIREASDDPTVRASQARYLELLERAAPSLDRRAEVTTRKAALRAQAAALRASAAALDAEADGLDHELAADNDVHAELARIEHGLRKIKEIDAALANIAGTGKTKKSRR